MKFSYNWLKELSGTERSAQEIAELLTVRAFEVEDVIEQGRGLENVVIGEVLTKEKHPDADRLNVATVDVGAQKLTIVCGAPNLDVGQKVPVALVGAQLPDGDDSFEIKKSTIRGVASNGMICAEDELGLGNDHEGIIVLPEDAPVSESFAKYKGLDDTILDIDILPNRAHDCLSHMGVAREISILDEKVLEEEPYTPMTSADTPPSDSFEVSIETNKCPRYSATLFANVKIGESPEWLKQRLIACDMQPINNVVDITNYVMLETGQPLHAFDLSGITQITVREATKGEKLLLLDDTETALVPDDIVITDGAKPIALAGVMGGKDSAVSNNSTDIILEAANFDATSIRRTHMRLECHTDAAYRFERAVDPNMIDRAVARASQLIEEICEAKITGHHDLYECPVEKGSLILPLQKVIHLLGVEISVKEVMSILSLLGISAEQKDDSLVCSIPTNRLDIVDQADLIEEIGRLYGYDKIAPKTMIGDVHSAVRNERRIFEHAIRDGFVAGGFDEVKGYSFYSREDAEALGLDDEAHVALMNPMSADQALMRRTLANSLLRAGKRNLSYFDHIDIFEIGRVFEPQTSALPDEKTMIAALSLSRDSKGEQFYHLKGVIDLLMKRAAIKDHYYDSDFDEDAADVVALHPSRKAQIKLSDGRVVGYIGEVTKRAQKYYGLKKARAAVCEMDLALLLEAAQAECFYETLAKFPVVARDLSMIVNAQTRVADIERVIYASGGELLRDVDLFDLYVDEEKDERSFAFHLDFAHPKRTLTSDEVDAVISKVITALESQTDATIRQ